MMLAYGWLPAGPCKHLHSAKLLGLTFQQAPALVSEECPQGHRRFLFIFTTERRLPCFHRSQKPVKGLLAARPQYLARIYANVTKCSQAFRWTMERTQHMASRQITHPGKHFGLKNY